MTKLYEAWKHIGGINESLQYLATSVHKATTAIEIMAG